MPEIGLTGLTSYKVNAPRGRGAAIKPVRPVRKPGMPSSDGSDVRGRPARARAARKAANPSDPSGSGTAAEVVQEMSGTCTHLVATQRIRISYIICGPGEPLCGTPEPLQSLISALFAPDVTCHICVAIAARDGISVAGSDTT